MVGDCVVFLVGGLAYPAIYHKPDKYYYDSVAWQTLPIDFKDADGLPLTVVSMASMEDTLVVLSEDGTVYKANYMVGTGRFTNIRMVDFSVEDKELHKIKSVGIGLGAGKAYGLPASRLQNEKLETPVVEASLGAAAKAQLTKTALPKSRTRAKMTSGNKHMLTLGFDRKDKGFGYYVEDGKEGFTKVRAMLFVSFSIQHLRVPTKSGSKSRLATTVIFSFRNEEYNVASSRCINRFPFVAVD